MNDHLINQIAAGEVVENPASVVKELVENAIDAESTEIVMEIKQGGRHLIKVSDNGTGMNREECEMAIKRHATSKIRSFSDFDALFTMGFRGEALPSIASVSKLTLLSSPMAGEGTLLSVSGTGMPSLYPAHRERGTTVEVKELFYNVPVRRKFQRPPAQDAIEVVQVAEELALANLKVGFTLIRDGETLFRLLPNEDLLQRIEALLGRDFSERLKPLHKEAEGMKLYGYIGEPTETRPNRKGQHLFINRRAVSSNLIGEAVKEGYGTTIAPMRFPVFALHLEIDPGSVDVNVHPQKKEVRLEAGEKLSRFVQLAVHEALREREREEVPRASIQVSPCFESLTRSFEPLEYHVERKGALDLQIPLAEEKQPELIGCIRGYLVVKDPDDRLLLFHQKRLHERLLFEKLRKRGEALPQELYLIPETFTLSPSESELLESHLETLKELGIELTRKSKESFALESAPVRFENKHLATMMRTILEQLAQSGKEGLEGAIRESIAKEIAKAGGVKMDRRLSRFEGEELLREFWKEEIPPTSLSGEPLYKEIERF